MKPIQLLSNVEIKAAAGDGTKSPRVEIVAYSGGKMNVCGFGEVVIDLKGLKFADSINLLADHDGTLKGIVGAGQARVDAGKLIVAGNLAGSSETAQQIIALHKEGVKFQASVGVVPLSRKLVRSINANGRTISSDSPFTYIPTGHLREVTITAVGCDSETSVAIAARHKGHNMAKRNALTAVVDDPNTIDDTSDGGDVVQAERERAAKFFEIAARYPDAQNAAGIVRQHLTDPDADGNGLEVSLLRANRPQMSHTITNRNRSGFPNQGAVLEASLCMSAGLPEKFVGEQFTEPVMVEAMSKPFRGIGIHAAFRHALQAAGRQCPSGNVALFNAAVELQASGISTLSLPGILSGVANKTMLQAYSAVQTTWRLFAAVASAPDFHEQTSYRLTGMGELDELAPGGEIKHGTLDEDTYTNTLKTYAKMIGVDRRDLINDSLSALTQIPRILGRKGAIKLEKVVYTTLLANIARAFSRPALATTSKVRRRARTTAGSTSRDLPVAKRSS